MYTLVMRLWFLLCFISFSLAGSVTSYALEPIKLRELYVDLHFYMPNGRNPLITENGIPGRYLNHQLNLTIKTDLFDYLYWDSMIHSLTDRGVSDPGQFRLIGLEMRLGVRIFPTLEVGLYHFSRHLLDAKLPYLFPVEDSVQVRWHLFKDNGTNSKSLF